MEIDAGRGDRQPAQCGFLEKLAKWSGEVPRGGRKVFAENLVKCL